MSLFKVGDILALKSRNDPKWRAEVLIADGLRIHSGPAYLIKVLDHNGAEYIGLNALVSGEKYERAPQTFKTTVITWRTINGRVGSSIYSSEAAFRKEWPTTTIIKVDIVEVEIPAL